MHSVVSVLCLFPVCLAAELFLYLVLNREKPTRVALKAVIVRVARWKLVAEQLQSAETMVKMEKMEAELACLMLGLGANVDQKPKKSGLFG